MRATARVSDTLNPLLHRLPWLLAVNGYLLSGLLVAVVFTRSSLSPMLILIGLLLLLFNNLLGWLSITHLKRLERQQCSLLREERDANRRLLEEINERRALEAKLRHMACIDGLTGIANRRHFFELAEQELRRARRDGTPLALCMVDVDLFKQLNDRHGHGVGDLALSLVADCCQSVLRESDVLGRYGGEEFVIALPLADLDTASAIAERLRESVSALKLPMFDDETPLTVTVGISRIETGESGLGPALQRADKALYAGKARGRNCVVVAPRLLPDTPPAFPGTDWASCLMTLSSADAAARHAGGIAAVPSIEPPYGRG